MDNNQILKLAQQKLQELGFYHGEIDGIYGNKTEGAILEYQKSQIFTDVIDTHSQWPKQDYDSMVTFYGLPGENQTMIELPYSMKIEWDLNKTINKFSCHKKIKEPLTRIFKNTLDYYGLEKIKQLKLDIFSGCLNVRKMRNGNSWSMHSWGVAIDLASEDNQLSWNHTKALFAKSEYNKFWEFVYREGAISLGKERDYDFQHFQFCGL